MKYTKLFNNHSEYVAYTGGTNFITPNVSWCIQDEEAHCTPLILVQNPVITCADGEVTITCSTAGSSIYYRLNEAGEYSAYTTVISITADTVVEAYAELNGATSNIVKQTCEYEHDYSLDYLTFDVITSGTILWVSSGLTKTISYSKDDGATWTPITSTTEGTSINVSARDKVLFKGSNDKYANSKTAFTAFSRGTATYNAEGNIMSLIYGDNFTGQTTLTQTWALSNVFNTSNIVSAENLIMPATTLTDCCYRATFANCHSLTKAPTLPAATLATGCYMYMFDWNTSMTSAPIISSTTMAVSAYTGMFNNCTGLTTAPDLPATTLADNCYSYMFSNCTSLTTAPELHATTLATQCYCSMFKDCTSLTTGPSSIGDSSTTMATSACTDMFMYCSGLTTAPALPAMTLASSCYGSMFRGCTSLTTAPVLPATTLVNSCYGMMFWDCFSLNSITCLATDISASYCTYEWVHSLPARGTFTKAASMEDWTTGVNGIPTGWIVKDDSDNYLTFNVTTGGDIKWNGSTTANTLSYSKDNGTTWATADSSTTISVAAGDKVLWKGTASPKTFDGIGNFSGDSVVKYNVEGNTMSLLYGDNFPLQKNLSGKAYAFCKLFQGSTNIVSAENMILPATTLSEGCYRYMFDGCTSLTTAPVLIATTLENGCYYGMFNGCVSLTTAPTLSAATLPQYCYYGMFSGCTSLVNAPQLNAATLADSCCRSMFNGCTSLTTAPILSAETLAQYCYNGMFDGCTSLTTVQSVLPATTLADWCYSGMFKGCTSLTTAPELPATTLAPTCYNGMFSGCTSLSAITCLATDISANYCTYQWVNNVAPSGTFTKATSMTSWTTGVNGIPTNWTVQNDGIEAPTISCDGEGVTMACSTPSATIYYRLDQTGNFAQYSNVIVITADTVVEAYSELGGESSTTVTETCVYSPITLVEPVISCDGENVTITCATLNATIYYSLDQGSYTEYSSSIPITADTVVSAYSSIYGRTSSAVTENCEYTHHHHYEEDYLTFDVLTSGTILWKQVGSVSKTISYSVDSGTTWTQITATTAGTAINVSAGDKVLFKGNNEKYANDKSNYSAFETSGTATYNIEGNIMSLIYGDDFSGKTSFSSGTYNFCSIFKQSNAVSAENLILPATTLTNYCYRAMFSKCHTLIKAPALPAMTLAQGCYWYMFEECAITTAPDLNAQTLVRECYGNMFTGCTSLNSITCLATGGFSAASATTSWVSGVAASGTFVKDGNTTWSTGVNGIPTGWVVKDADALAEPTISFDGFDTIILACETTGATIYYRLNQSGTYSAYTTAITITADTTVEAYSEESGETSSIVSQNCVYVSSDPFAYSNRSLDSWTYVNDSINVTVPYSVNAIDGHSGHYKTDGDSPKLPFSFDTSFTLKEAQPTYIWFEHADQSADIYVDNTLVETHWGGYNAFFSDISNYVHAGTNNIRVSLRNKQRSDLAPCAGDFNFNATLGYVKLFTSQYMPSTEYGYDGFHVTSSFEYSDTARTTASAATISVKTEIPTGATVICTIKSGSTNIYSASSASTSEEMTFTTPSITGSSLHLWNGMADPFLYDITLEIYHGQDLYHRYTRPYGLRYYEYLINDTERYGTVGNPFTGFKLNGQTYLLRGVCMHNDKDGKANALTSADIAADFSIVQELGCNFIRLAHYPHPKEVYDTCDRMGIVVQTEVPWVNQSSSGQPEDYYTRLEGQYDDMVKQHYNHPCIFFWGLANEITPSTTSFTKAKIEQYAAQIKALDSERLVGFVMSHSYNSPTSFGSPNVDWFGCNIYVGWYVDKTSNNPTSQLNTRVTNFITNAQKPFAFSEYGCGGTQLCHSDNPSSTTTKGTNQPRHDIEYQMWLHEGHIASIKNFPQLLFTAQWQLFDIAVYNRQEGYTICLDGENTSTDDNLKYLNNKGLVERDHVTKKDTFYLYKAWWNSTPFVHICGKDYTKTVDRVIKCYSNENTLSLYVNNSFVESATVTNNIATFTARNFNSGDAIRVEGDTTNDTFTFENKVIAKFNVTSTSSPIRIASSTTSISSVEIDGVVQPSVESHYTFSTTGEHTVKYTLVNQTIGQMTFSGCTDMVSVFIPSVVTSIGNYAFRTCSALTSCTIPQNSQLTTIGESAFTYCYSLTSFNIPSGVTTIGSYAFYNCSGLTSIDIPSGVTNIGYETFKDCSGLTSITSNAMTAPTIRSNTFQGINTNGTLYVPNGSSGYDTWMQNADYYLGLYNWTKVEQ